MSTFVANLSTKDRQALGTAIDGQLHSMHKRKIELAHRRTMGAIDHCRAVSGHTALNEHVHYLRDLKERLGIGGDNKVSQQPRIIDADIAFVDDVVRFEEAITLEVDVHQWENEGGGGHLSADLN